MVSEKVIEQIKTVRDTGLTNMMDVRRVQRIANDLGFYDLVILIEEEKSKYVNFIMRGK
ncbi:MAG TPA: DUF5049 domain-containing protein [Lachnospiraceae bacterium]|nr:DUF5049 domain-containing protein [Lachnospiraceae bacterium]